MTDTCPEGHSLRNGDRLLSECYVCANESLFWAAQLARAELYAARTELEASGATYWADRDAAAGVLPSRQYLPEAERRRVYAPEQQ